MSIHWISERLRDRLKELSENEAAQNSRPIASGIDVRARRLMAGAVGFSPDFTSNPKETP
jgi:hypothetical protein